MAGAGTTKAEELGLVYMADDIELQLLSQAAINKGWKC